MSTTPIPIPAGATIGEPASSSPATPSTSPQAVPIPAGATIGAPTPSPTAPASAPSATPTKIDWFGMGTEPIWEQIKQSFTNNPISNKITQVLSTPSKMAEERRQANLVAVAQGKPAPYSETINTLLGEAGTGGRMLGEFTQPKNLAIIPAAGVAPVTIEAAIAGNGFKALLTPRQPGETPAQEEERRLMGAAMLFGGAGGAAEAAKVGAPDAAISAAEKTAGKVSNAAKGAIEKVKNAKETYNPSSLEENVRRMSPPSKNQAADYAETVKAASSQLRDIFREHPDVKTPSDVVNAIQGRIDTIESHLNQQARAIEEQPGFPPAKAVLDNADGTVEKALDDYFTEHRGAYTPEQIEAAKNQVLDRVRQGNEDLPRNPSLFEAENLRKQLNKENATSYNDASVPSAVKDAKQVAAGALRSMIDQKYEELGVNGVKEWRAQEAPLIDVRDQLKAGFAKAAEMGRWNLIRSAINNIRAGALGAGIGSFGTLFGGGAGAMGAGGAVIEAGAIARDFAKNLQTNPNLATERAAKIANREAAPTNVAKPQMGTNIEANFQSKAVADIKPSRVFENGKSYEEQRYPATVPVRVDFGNGDVFYDKVKGMNIGHALSRAKGNWPGAEVTPATEGEFNRDANHKIEANPKSSIQPIPAALKGNAKIPDESIIGHEYGHGASAIASGGKLEELRSNWHPQNMVDNAAASARVTWPAEGAKSPDEWLSKPDNMMNFVQNYLAGGVTQKVLDGIKPEENPGLVGDIASVKETLNKVGITDPKQQQDVIEYLQKDWENKLTTPNPKTGRTLGDIIKEYRQEREDGLPEERLASLRKIRDFTKEVQQHVHNAGSK